MSRLVVSHFSSSPLNRPHPRARRSLSLKRFYKILILDENRIESDRILQPIGKEEGWRETKAALALDRACLQSPTLVDLPPPPPAPSPPPPPPRSRFSVWGLISMDVSEDEKEPPSSRSLPHRQQPPLLDPPIRKFLEVGGGNCFFLPFCVRGHQAVES